MDKKPFSRAPIRANRRPSTSYYKWRHYYNGVREADPERFPKRAVYLTSNIESVHGSIYFIWWMLNDFT